MSDYLEQVIFFYVIKDLELTTNFKPNFFNKKILKEIFSLIKPFILEYRTEPTENQTYELVKVANKEDLISQDQIHTLWKTKENLSQFTPEWLHENTVAFAEWQNFDLALRRVLAYIKTVGTDITFENCKEIVERAKAMFTSEANFNLNTNKGHDFFDPETHILTEKDTKTSGYNFIDLCLNGGFSKKTLNVFMGSPKVGKSMWLCNLAAKSVINGNNSAYITLEMSYQMVSQRIGANIFEVPIKQYKELSKDKNYLTEKIKTFNNNHLMIKPGTFIIEEFPTSSATVYDIESFLLKKEEELSTPDKKFKFDNVFIDYINIMKDFKNPNSENTYQKIKSICEDVRAMAQRNFWCVISVTQTNRSAFDVSDLTMSNVSESAGLLATVDSLFGIIQTAIMRAEGIYFLKGIAMRDSEHMGDKKQFKINKDFLRIEEDTTQDIIPENIGLPAKYETQNKPQYGYQMSKDANTTNEVFNTNLGQINNNMAEPQLGLTEITGQKLF